MSNNKRAHKYPFQDPFTKQHIQIQRRKLELFKRDPAAMVMVGLLKKEAVPPEVFALLSSGGLGKKWNTTIWRTTEVEGEPVALNGPFSTINLGMLPNPVVDGRDRYRMENIPLQQHTTVGDDGNEEVRFYRLLPIGEGRIPIIIDPDLLTQQDSKKVKEHVWSLVEKEILKRKEVEAPAKGWNPLAPEGEPKEVAFIYRTDEATFQKHLKWYDLHMGDNPITPKGLSFRTIAHFDREEQKGHEALEEAKRKILENKKVVRSTRGEKILEFVVGEHVKGEDAVEKGVKQIYKAIHRKPYPSKRTKLGLYCCSTHGDMCPESCRYRRQWMHKFNKCNMLFKPLQTQDGESIVDPNGEQPPTQGTGSRLMGISSSEDEEF